MKHKGTLQTKLLKALETIAAKSAVDKPRLTNCIATLKSVKIPDDDYINTLTFIKLLLDEIPAAQIHYKPLLELFQFCRKHVEAPAESHTQRRKLSKR